MIERPMSFSPPMVRAIRDGKKTQTRRVAKTQKPPCAAGDVLWVRETHALDVPGCPGGVSFRADHIDPRGDGPAHPMRWRSPRFMPRWAARFHLHVEGIRAERLDVISEADAVAEGVGSRAEFIDLWRSIHGDWQREFVWVIDFTPLGSDGARRRGGR